jgi:hypothetical protein
VDVIHSLACNFIDSLLYSFIGVLVLSRRLAVFVSKGYAMSGQHNEGRLGDLKRAYDDYLHGLFGDNVPNERFRENLASGILYLARADKREWESMAKHTGSPVASLIAKRELLIRHET